MMPRPRGQRAEVALSTTLNPVLPPQASLWCLSVCVEHFDIIMRNKEINLPSKMGATMWQNDDLSGPPKSIPV